MKHLLLITVTKFMHCLSLLFLCILNLCITVSAQIKVVPKANIPAVFGFGDSIIDPGNNNDLLLTLIKANFPPYGRDFEGEKATGRFSNGRISTDFLVDALGVKKNLPAYMDSSLEDHDLLTGVSFASAATGFDPLTPKIFFVRSMKEQLKMFKEYIGRVKEMVGESITNFILDNSAYVVVCGTNDITNTYFGTPFTRDDYDIESYTDLVRNAASSFIKKLYKLGARKIYMTNVPPVGCLPSQRTLGGGAERECAKNREEATESFNKKLAAELESLGDRLSDSKIVLWDLYSIFLDLIENSTTYGFEVVDKGCCGSGVIEMAVLCNPFSSMCEDANKYLYWDSFHPSERANQLVVDRIVEKYMKHFF